MRNGRRLGACGFVVIVSLASRIACAEGGHASLDDRRYAVHPALQLLQRADLEYFVTKRQADKLVRAPGLGASTAALRWHTPGTLASLDADTQNPAGDALPFNLRSKRNAIPPGFYLFGRAGAVRWRTPLGGCDNSAPNCAFNLGIRPNGIPKIPGSNLYVGVYYAF